MRGHGRPVAWESSNLSGHFSILTLGKKQQIAMRPPHGQMEKWQESGRDGKQMTWRSLDTPAAPLHLLHPVPLLHSPNFLQRERNLSSYSSLLSSTCITPSSQRRRTSKVPFSSLHTAVFGAAIASRPTVACRVGAHHWSASTSKLPGSSTCSSPVLTSTHKSPSPTYALNDTCSLSQ